MYFLTGKAKRIKQARDEAQAEIERYRQDGERQFREFEAKHMGCREDVAARIDKNTEIYMVQMAQEVANNKEKVGKQQRFLKSNMGTCTLFTVSGSTEFSKFGN